MRLGLIILIALILIAVFGILFLFYNAQKPKGEITATSASITPTPTPTPIDTNFTSYIKPVIPKSDKYIIYLLGDSMTHAFGPRGGIFSELLSDQYPDKNFEVFNYGEAGFNISQLPVRLNEEVQASEELRFRSVLSGDPEPDVIILESYGYNPLSDLGKVDGLRKQQEILFQLMNTLTKRYPNTVIMFMSAIAPDKTTYSLSATGADAQGRWAQAEERIEYITAHMEFAREHNIPLIDTYTPSLDLDGDGDTKYINPDDDIHPSAEGLAHMARIMVEKIYEEKIFP